MTKHLMDFPLPVVKTVVDRFVANVDREYVPEVVHGLLVDFNKEPAQAGDYAESQTNEVPALDAFPSPLLVPLVPLRVGPVGRLTATLSELPRRTI